HPARLGYRPGNRTAVRTGVAQADRDARACAGSLFAPAGGKRAEGAFARLTARSGGRSSAATFPACLRRLSGVWFTVRPGRGRVNRLRSGRRPTGGVNIREEVFSLRRDPCGTAG